MDLEIQVKQINQRQYQKCKMVKILLDKYPKGSFPKQQSDGKYMDGYLHENLKIPAKKIVDDMTFLGVVSSSTLEVGTGKSVLVQQIGEAYTELVNKEHGLNLTFDMKNIVFNPADLIKRAFELPKYSCIILDEWEDNHYWSALATTLRQFFRKCRQLNLFMILIIPNFFQLPMPYAVSRSLFFIDVRFQGEFERGFFSFYNFKKKKTLYIKGKKTHDYNVTKPDFYGRFPDGYAVPREVYVAGKHKDMMDDHFEKKVPTESDIKAKYFHKLYQNLEGITIKKLSEAFGVSERTGDRYLQVVREANGATVSSETEFPIQSAKLPFVKKVSVVRKTTTPPEDFETNDSPILNEEDNNGEEE